MSNANLDAGDAAVSIEVLVYRDDEIVHRQICGSADEAAALAATWEADERVRCELHQLSSAEPDEDITEMILVDPDDDAYPNP